MQVSEPTAIQETLYVIDMLKKEKRDISVVAVWKRLIVETGYEYPRSVIEQTIQDYDQYVFNVKTHGYERDGIAIRLVSSLPTLGSGTIERTGNVIERCILM